MKGKKGFSLIELILIIIIIAVTAAIAVPKYFSPRSNPIYAAEKGVVQGVKVGISNYYSTNKAWPAVLDNAADGEASRENVLFTNVLPGGIARDWVKNSLIYTGPTKAQYVYDPQTGGFIKK